MKVKISNYDSHEEICNYETSARSFRDAIDEIYIRQEKENILHLVQHYPLVRDNDTSIEGCFFAGLGIIAIYDYKTFATSKLCGNFDIAYSGSMTTIGNVEFSEKEPRNVIVVGESGNKELPLRLEIELYLGNTDYNDTCVEKIIKQSLPEQRCKR